MSDLRTQSDAIRAVWFDYIAFTARTALFTSKWSAL